MVSPGAEPDPGLVSVNYGAALDSEGPGLWTPIHLDGPSPRAGHLPPTSQPDYRIRELKIALDLVREALDRLPHGVVVVDAGARVLFANHAAEGLLADSRGALRIEGQRLSARHADSAALSHLVRVAVREGTGGSMVISRNGHPTLMVVAAAVRPAADAARHSGHAILFLKALETPARRSSRAFVRYFALTRAQAALANEIVRGDGVGAAAARLRISYGTARAHLLQIFQKTGLRRQSELVRLILEWDEGTCQLADAAPGKSP